MTARNITSGRADRGQANPSTYSANTRADPYKMPSGSILPDPLTDVQRSSASGLFFTVFFSLMFAIPLLLAGVMIKFR